ncbi:MAG: hypothetical protein V3W14_01540 [Candidatus Neomarinimicrobiota bacterium]
MIGPQHNRPGRSPAVVFLLLVSSVALLGLARPLQEASEQHVQSNPVAGRIVFEEKGCTDCHSVDGYDSNVGPDLGRSRVFGSFYDLAARLWNHAPQMAIRAGYLAKDWSVMTTEELDQLTSYLFYLRYLGEPGSVSQGRALIKEKGCLNCHSIGSEGNSDGVALDRLQEYASPLYFAQSLWNHGPDMQEKMEEMGIERPTFGDEDITHISAFLQEFSRGYSTRRHYMTPGNPQAGAELFRTYTCTGCHALEPGAKSVGTPLPEMSLHRSVTAIAGTMWNHGPMMWAAMDEAGIEWPTFEGSQMADLIAHLYFFGYQGKPGDPATGEQVFEEKGCADCHGVGEDLELGSDQPLTRPSELVTTMWNHVPDMRELTLTRNIVWPELTAEELSHLYAYLVQVAGG